jgi:UDP-glucose:(heptosyl)LPS alpha-1,3-glucosyltransferase
MKIAFCLFKYFPYGGLQRDFLRIARTCQKRGHEIHVYTMCWKGEQEPGFHLHVLHPNGAQNHTRILSYINQLQAILNQERHDLVVGFNKMPGLDIYYAADVCYRSRMAEKKYHWLYHLLPRYRTLLTLEESVFAKGNQTKIMLISPTQQTEFGRWYQTEDWRFHLLPPGIARDRIAPPNAMEIRERIRKTHKLQANDLLLLMVGSGFKTKGVDRSIKGLASLPETLKLKTQLWVIGQDDAHPFQQLAHALGIANQVRFLGGRFDIPDFLLAADLFLHPAYHENTGTVLLEAVIAGLPVLTVDVCGYAHYINDARAGMVLSSPFNQAELNAVIKKMLLLEKEREIWRQNGLAFASTADIYSLPDKVADIIEQGV